MTRALAAAALAATACISPVDYAAVPDADGGVDAPLQLAHDEDADGIDDSVDNCPTVWDESPKNSDADALGDACDPQPDGPINRIIHLSTFGPATARWSDDGTPWPLDGDALIISARSGAGGADSPVELTGPRRVVATFTLVDPGPAADVSLFGEYTPSNLDGSECYVTRTQASGSGTLGWSPVIGGIRNDQNGTAAPLSSSVFDQRGRLELAAAHVIPDANEVPRTRCSYYSDIVATVEHRTGNPSDGAVRVAVRDADVRVESVIVYSLSPDPETVP